MITDSDEPTSSGSSSSSVASTYHGNKKGSYFKERIEERVAILKETYCCSHGSDVSQSDVINLLCLPDSREGKQIATTAIGKAFGNIITLSRRKNMYKGLKKHASFSIDEDSALKLDQGSAISKMKEFDQHNQSKIRGLENRTRTI